MNSFLGLEDAQNPYNYKSHFMPYLENKQKLDILFLKYEDLQQNPAAAVRNILQHLDLSHVRFSSEELSQVIQGRKESMLSSWNALSTSIFTKDFSSYFDPDLLNMVDKELKVNWKLLNSGPV